MIGRIKKWILAGTAVLAISAALVPLLVALAALLVVLLVLVLALVITWKTTTRGKRAES